MSVPVIKKACVDSKYFTTRGFAKESESVYTRIEHRNFMFNGQVIPQERKITFKVYDVHPELGTNIELYWNNLYSGSGYWIDREDFEKQFQNL